MLFRHLWLWESAIPVLVALAYTLLYIVGKKVDQNNIPEFKGLREYLRTETAPAAAVEDSADAGGVLANLGESLAFHQEATATQPAPLFDRTSGLALPLASVLDRAAYSDIEGDQHSRNPPIELEGPHPGAFKW